MTITNDIPSVPTHRNYYPKILLIQPNTEILYLVVPNKKIKRTVIFFLVSADRNYSDILNILLG